MGGILENKIKIKVVNRKNNNCVCFLIICKKEREKGRFKWGVKGI